MDAPDKIAGKRKFLRPRILVPLAGALFAILLLPGASVYYSYSQGLVREMP